MRVAHINWELGFGGIETMLVNIANIQANLGAEVHVILLNDRNENSMLASIHSNVHLHFINRRVGTKGLGFMLRLNKMLIKLNPDVIHLHHSRFYSLLIHRKLKKRAVSTLHSLPRGKTRESILSKVCPLFEFVKGSGNLSMIDKIPRVFAISKSVQQDLLKNYNISSQLIVNGILTKEFQKRSYRNADSPLQIVQVSRLLHSSKGQDLLIRAAARLQGKVHVTFIGDGPSMDFLKGLAKELKAEEWISFAGKHEQSYVADHLQDYDLFAQPSRNEGFGLTVAEAMAANLPVLVANNQGPAEVTEGNRFGWVFENNDVDDLVRMIEYIRTHYDEALAKCEKAREHVIENYDVSVTAKRYLELYRS